MLIQTISFNQNILICVQTKCSCSGRQYDFSFFTTTMPLALHKGDMQNTKCRIVNREQKSSLVSKLDYLEKSYFSRLNDLKRMPHTPLLAPTNLLCGFSDLQKSQVLEHCHKTFILTLMFGNHALQVIFCL